MMVINAWVVCALRRIIELHASVLVTCVCTYVYLHVCTCAVTAERGCGWKESVGEAQLLGVREPFLEEAVKPELGFVMWVKEMRFPSLRCAAGGHSLSPVLLQPNGLCLQRAFRWPSTRAETTVYTHLYVHGRGAQGMCVSACACTSCVDTHTLVLMHVLHTRVLVSLCVCADAVYV